VKNQQEAKELGLLVGYLYFQERIRDCREEMGED